MTDDPEMQRLVLLLCATRAFVDFRSARAADDLWLPFLPREDGTWGRLVSSHRRAGLPGGGARGEKRHPSTSGRG